MAKILLVDDDPLALESTHKILLLDHHLVSLAHDGQEAIEQIKQKKIKNDTFDLVLTDVRMPRLGGLEFLRAVSLWGNPIPVILMTAFGRIEDAVWAMKLGAVNYLTKPFSRRSLLSVIKLSLENKTHKSPKKILTPLIGVPLFGSSQKMQELQEMVLRVAKTQATTLITGESGTGKELIARYLHENSDRAMQPLVAINCAAFPESLIESELFGFEKGAFTGALVTKPGLFEAAHLGTLFLDEIGEMPYPLQSKMLRVLQEEEVRKVGSVISKKIDVRIIASTHQDLWENVKLGRFREDLLYRLEVVHFHLPPLRERKEDILPLAQYFLNRFCEKHGKAIKSLEENVTKVLVNHIWPGNVRELSNVVERAVIFSRSHEVRFEDLPAPIILAAKQAMRSPQDREKLEAQISSITVPVGMPLKKVEEILIQKTLEATSGNKNQTAKLLGINSRTIYRKLYEKKQNTGGEMPDNP